MSFIKKENLTIVIEKYQDAQGNEKNKYKTIGELVTMQGNDGPYQFFKLWGAGGVVEGKVFSQDDNNQTQPQQAPHQQFQPAQQAGFQQPAQTQPQGQPIYDPQGNIVGYK